MIRNVARTAKKVAYIPRLTTLMQGLYALVGTVVAVKGAFFTQVVVRSSNKSIYRSSVIVNRPDLIVIALGLLIIIGAAVWFFSQERD